MVIVLVHILSIYGKVFSFYCCIVKATYCSLCAKVRVKEQLIACCYSNKDHTRQVERLALHRIA